MCAVIVHVNTILQQVAKLGVRVVSPPSAVLHLVAVVGTVNHLLAGNKVQVVAMAPARNLTLKVEGHIYLMKYVF